MLTCQLFSKGTMCLLDCLLHADHGVSAPVEEEVGGGAVLGAGHQLLRRGLDDAVVTVQPARVTCNMDTCK